MPSLGRLLPRLRREVRRSLAHRGLAPGTLVYRCNICSASGAVAQPELGREKALCLRCGANMRFRAVVHHLSQALFGASLPIAEFPAEAARLSGIGMSDEHVYASRLGERLRYANTFFHQEPRLDIHALAERHLGAYDFVLSSDVLEHVAPPVGRAFANLRRLLRPGGVLVLTVPFVMEGDTTEHFPELHDYALERRGGAFVLVNRTFDGRRQEFARLVFHGGPGSTLEMRVFSLAGLRRELERAGFAEIRFHPEACLPFGICWPGPWSVPVTARAPR